MNKKGHFHFLPDQQSGKVTTPHLPESNLLCGIVLLFWLCVLYRSNVWGGKGERTTDWRLCDAAGKKRGRNACDGGLNRFDKTHKQPLRHVTENFGTRQKIISGYWIFAVQKTTWVEWRAIRRARPVSALCTTKETHEINMDVQIRQLVVCGEVRSWRISTDYYMLLVFCSSPRGRLQCVLCL